MFEYLTPVKHVSSWSQSDGVGGARWCKRGGIVRPQTELEWGRHAKRAGRFPQLISIPQPYTTAHIYRYEIGLFGNTIDEMLR